MTPTQRTLLFRTILTPIAVWGGRWHLEILYYRLDVKEWFGYAYRQINQILRKPSKKRQYWSGFV
jgi:hypothetical protein